MLHGMHKDKMAKVMHEFKAGRLRSGLPGGPKVKSSKQAVAIGMSYRRKMKKKKEHPMVAGLRRMPSGKA